MLAQEVKGLELENQRLKQALAELGKKLEGQDGPKTSCRYCKHFVQHYIKWYGGYSEIYEGHCTSGVPVKKGGIKHPHPFDACPYFEFGTFEMKRPV